MDNSESRMNPRFLAESEKPRVIESGREMAAGFDEENKEKRRASVLSLLTLRDSTHPDSPHRDLCTTFTFFSPHLLCKYVCNVMYASSSGLGFLD